MIRIFPMLFCLLLTAPSIVRADTIVLKSGKTLEGEMVDCSDEDVTLEREGTAYKIKFNMVAKITLSPAAEEDRAQLKQLIVARFNELQEKKDQRTAALLKRIESKKVEFYMASWCPYCRKMEAFLSENKIKYTRYDIEHDLMAKKKYAQLGRKGIPVIKIDNVIIEGYNPKGVLAALMR